MSDIERSLLTSAVNYADAEEYGYLLLDSLPEIRRSIALLLNGRSSKMLRKRLLVERDPEVKRALNRSIKRESRTPKRRTIGEILTLERKLYGSPDRKPTN